MEYAVPTHKMMENRDTEGLLNAFTEQELNPGREVCPLCGRGLVIHGTAAGDRYGVCMACLERAKANAMREYIRAIREFKECAAVREEAYKLRKRLGVGADEVPKPKPIFDK